MDDRLMSSSARITDSGRKGDLRIAFGFERFDRQPQACMYIYAARSPRQIASIPITQMYRFDTREIDPATRENVAMPHARRVAEVVYGGVPSRMEVHRVLDAISDWMTDFKNMPPPATWRDPAALEAALAQRGYEFVR